MRLNVFNLKDRRDDWEAVEDAMHKIWVGSQKGAILPKCCDFEFKKQFKRMKENYTLNECKQILKIA